MSSSEPAVKVAGVLSLLKIARQRLGEAAFARMVAGLPPDERAIVEKPPLPVSWLPLAQATLIEQAIAGAFGHDLAQLTELSREQMKHDLGTVYRVFMRVASPKYVAERAAQIYTTYTRNAGRMHLSDQGDNWVEITVEGVPRPDAVFFAFRRGNILGSIAATGVKDVRCDIVRGGDSEPFAVYRTSWR